MTHPTHQEGKDMTDMTMIGRVNSALEDYIRKTSNWTTSELARVAMEAMGSPTPSMWEAGAVFLPITGDPEPIDAHHVFVAMMAAALAEKPE
jgi:hypothetical protein